jgi:SAM-dependent methyltransferase
MDACGCDDRFAIFDGASAEADLQRYRRHGPDRTTRLLLEMIRARGVRDASVLDIGGGIGVVDHELLREGARGVVLVDGSAPSLEAARDEGRRQSHLDRLELVHGDFVSQAEAIEPADIVTLDRVVCCYPDMLSLVRLSASRARALYGLVLPRDRSIIRWGLRLMNVWFRIRGLTYRAFAHSNAHVDVIVEEAGLRPASEAHTFFWRVVLYDRSATRP